MTCETQWSANTLHQTLPSHLCPGTHPAQIIACKLATKVLPVVARLDYPGIGPEHSWLMDTGRAEYHAITDAQALDALQLVSKLEGIIPALETSHAFAYLEVSLSAALCMLWRPTGSQHSSASAACQSPCAHIHADSAPCSATAAWMMLSGALTGRRVLLRIIASAAAVQDIHHLHTVQALCPTLPDGTRIVINLSGRGDKDVQTVAKALNNKF